MLVPFRLVTIVNPLPTPFLLVGSQLGSLNSLAYLQSFPEQVAQIVLIDPISKSMFEDDMDKDVKENRPISWRKFWINKQIPLFRFLQISAMMGLNRIAILLGLLDIPGAFPSHGGEEEGSSSDTETSIGEPENVAGMRLRHFMSNPSHLGAAALELGMKVEETNNG